MERCLSGGNDEISSRFRNAGLEPEVCRDQGIIGQYPQDSGPKFVQQIKLVEEIMGLGSARVRSPRLSLSDSEARHVYGIVGKTLENRPRV